MDSSSETDKNFFKYVFNFDDDSKSDILNIMQYTLLAIIPVVILTKTLGKYIPEASDKKGSLEISAEIIIQVIVTFIGLLLIHRIITYVPTYSATKYPNFNIIFIVLAMLMITMSLQTKMGEKVTILVDRVLELWNGKKESKKGSGGKNGDGTVKVSQPISGGGGGGGSTSAMNQSLYTEGTAVSALPTTESLPNYDAMYRQDTTPLVNAATPGMTQESFVPVAASELLGGSFGGANW